ncbi:MAG TPA: type I DNA topoisomerase [Acidobacteriaceae bacterium]|nr:type I DNA topoisomerase [Acidobacteriaceae bacterium]
MSKSLVIVESPAKAKTINKYLGKDFTVEASLGHIKDLPKNKIGVDLSDGSFEPELIVIPGKEKVVDRLKKLAKSATAIYLAPDPDREGEAIAAHLHDELKGVSKKNAIHRVTFNEITPKAVRAAFEHARDVDQHLVDAQQTRRVLDRIVGYQISPLLWDKVRRGLSAGRVQTVALRLIVEREREIQAFVPVEYWTLDALLTPAREKTEFTARFVGIDGTKAAVETVDAPALPGKQEADAVVAALGKAAWKVRNVEKRERRRNAAAPFTTSKLQQDAARQLGFSVKRTMGVAQRLYEGLELGSEGSVGLITYMRTDSTRVSPEAIAEVRSWIEQKHGKQYLPASPNAFKSKKDAQDAHEAIRPTSVERHPDQVRNYVSDEQFRLYRLIWQRFVASQMVPAVYDQTTVDIAAQADRRYDFRVTGSVLKFDGFLKVYEESKEKKDEEDDELKNQLPPLENGQALSLKHLLPEQHSTEPKPRFNEASLVRELEERGIGRPSTYATIINTIQEREYVTKVGGGKGSRFVPTEIGLVVTDLLVANFPYIFDPQYTARLEEELDDIEDGKELWTTLLGGFYGHFEEELKHAEKHMENIKRMEKPTDEKCELCGSPLVLKWGKFGSFFACSAYDKKDPNSCTFTKENFAAKPELQSSDAQEAEQNEEYCENCGRVMVLKRGRFGMFMACPGYNEDPPCKTTRRLNQKQQQKPPQPLDEKCPKCGEPLVLRNGPYGEFVSCSGYPKCKYIKQNLVEGMKCPTCGDGDIAERKARRGNIFYGCTNYPKCDFTSNWKPVPRKCAECGSPYLLEKTLKSGVYLVCPNNRKPSGEEEPEKKKKGKQKGAAEPEATCTFIEKIADPPSENVEAMRYQTKPEALPVG